MLRSSGFGWRGHPPLPSFPLQILLCPPNSPLQKHKYSSSHMQCPLTIGFTSSDLSFAYFLRRGEGLEGKWGKRKLQLPAPCFRPSSVHQPQFKQKGFEEIARKNSSHTLQGEEGQEESQHPDTVQPVGPHASLSLAPLPLPFSPSLRFSPFFFFSSLKLNGIQCLLQSPWALLCQLCQSSRSKS